MMQRMEQSRRQGRPDLRDHGQALSLVPEQVPPAPDEEPEDPPIEGPVLRLLPQPAPLGHEERVEL